MRDEGEGGVGREGHRRVRARVHAGGGAVEGGAGGGIGGAVGRHGVLHRQWRFVALPSPGLLVSLLFWTPCRTSINRCDLAAANAMPPSSCSGSRRRRQGAESTLQVQGIVCFMQQINRNARLPARAAASEKKKQFQPQLTLAPATHDGLGLICSAMCCCSGKKILSISAATFTQKKKGCSIVHLSHTI